VKEKAMSPKTCAACDCTLEGDPIKVKIGGKTVEVCCDECAQKLKEAGASAKSARRG
jgi:ribosome-binding protein aMBF1 (putative translation factor)